MSNTHDDHTKRTPGARGTRARGAAALLVVLALACSRVDTDDAKETKSSSNGTTAGVASIPPKEATSVGVPPALASAAEYGEQLYDAAKAGNWKTAEALMDSLDASTKVVTSSANTQSTASELTAAVEKLRPAVKARDKSSAAQVANEVTKVAALLSDQFHPLVPTAVILLDYYGRELELWAGAKDAAKLSETVAALRKTWDSVRADVIAHKGDKEAKATDELIAKIVVAKTPAEFSKLAKPLLDEVDELEKVYEK